VNLSTRAFVVQKSPKSRTKLASRGQLLAIASAAGLAMPGAVRWSGHLPPTLAWVIDLATHWQWLFVAGLALGGCMGLLGRRWRVVPLLLLAAVPFMTATAPLDASELPPRTSLTVASANVHLSNTDPRRLLAWLRDEKVDVAILLEVTPAYAAALEEQAVDFPHRKVVASSDPFGIAVLARTPISQVKVHQLTTGPDYISFESTFQGQPVQLAALHTMPPTCPEHYLARDRDLTRVMREAAAGKGPAIVAGDLNASAWSSALLAAEAQGFRRTTSLAPTWHTAMQGVIGIPIDHVLASTHWALVESSRGPAIGSDHYPVLSRLVLRR
jgi:endonuclease/exonuclease/phosphatase (EEP) superfamily protein YafD